MNTERDLIQLERKISDLEKDLEKELKLIHEIRNKYLFYLAIIFIIEGILLFFIPSLAFLAFIVLGFFILFLSLNKSSFPKFIGIINKY